MKTVVNIEGRVKSVRKKNEHTTLTNLPWTDHKTKPKELKLNVATLTLGLRPRQGLVRLQAKREARE